MGDPGPRKGLAQVFADTSFVADDERPQDGGGLLVELGIKEPADSPAGLFDAGAYTVAVLARAPDCRVVPEKR